MTDRMPTVDELRARVKPSGPWFEVPAGTPEADCSRCDADHVYWIKTTSGKPMLVDCAVTGGRIPGLNNTTDMTGRGVSHFATCPAADKFRASKRK